ncbi:sensor histidine kinase [Cerasicoccus frondis]|uniref:sensor histidine kinase n=1 Tax=Cerasicoccus frondis TaxID=490090 RepID=UPI002852BB11|nr:ATP-binding protein [Cerasicoccus frondis]
MAISLKWKIQLWHALILGVVLIVLGTGFYFYEKSRRQSQIDQELDQNVPPLIGAAANESRGPRGEQRMRGADQRPRPLAQGPAYREGASNTESPPWESLRNFHLPDGFYATLIDRRTGTVRYQSSNYPSMLLPEVPNGGYVFRTRDGTKRELFHSHPFYTVVIGTDLAVFHSGLTMLIWQIVGATLLIFGLGLVVGYFLINRALKPLQDIEVTAEKIARGELHERIPTPNKGQSSEIIELTNHLNETFAQLEALVDRQVRFTADASHELRTPLTALMAQIALGLKRTRTTEEYTRLFEVCQRSGQRIQRITEQLIELSKFDSGRVDLDYEELPLGGMLMELTEELQAYVKDRGSELKTDLSAGVIRCDPFRLEQVITNLVNNAIQHNIRPITITLRGWFDGPTAIIEVSDDGKGIQPENLDKLFDRFFQESVSHTTRHNNVGLGLAISSAIVEAHGGRLSAASQPDVKTTFRITLPQVIPPGNVTQQFPTTATIAYSGTSASAAT